jgi:hypothetical protein
MERAPRSEQAGQGSDEVDEKNDRITHYRIVAAQEIPTNYGETTIHQPHRAANLTLSGMGRVADHSGFRPSCGLENVTTSAARDGPSTEFE